MPAMTRTQARMARALEAAPEPESNAPALNAQPEQPLPSHSTSSPDPTHTCSLSPVGDSDGVGSPDWEGVDLLEEANSPLPTCEYF